MNVFSHPLARLAPVFGGCLLAASCVSSTPPGDVEDPDNPIEDPPVVPATPEYPVAKPGEKPNTVISPYAPYNVIDVAGFQSGQLARDPITKQIFRVP